MLSQNIKINRAVSVVSKNEMTNTNHNKLERNNGMLKMKTVQGKRVYLWSKLENMSWEDKNNKSQMK